MIERLLNKWIVFDDPPNRNVFYLVDFDPVLSRFQGYFTGMKDYGVSEHVTSFDFIRDQSDWSRARIIESETILDELNVLLAKYLLSG